MPTPADLQQAEFASFMRAYQDMVYSTAARLTGNEAQAEDIAQEVFLRAYENFEQLRADSAGGWLKTVTTNLALNHLSRYRRRWRFFSELHHDAARDEDSPEPDFELPDCLLDGLQERERHLLVEQALRRLPDRQRVPLVLYHFEDLSYDQIAVKLGISLSKVKTDISRARAALAKFLVLNRAHEA